MNFSHLIQINDPRNPAIEPLSRPQLWHGLVMRAERPSYFLIGLDECAILERGPDWLERKLRFGSLIVRDRVQFDPFNEVRYETEATRDVPGGTLVMRIEEPAPGELFVRFDYELRNADNQVENYFDEFRKSAYVESDIDTVRMIRQISASGLL